MVLDSLEVEQILLRDPACVYPRMDDPTKEMYRNAVQILARQCNSSEKAIAQRAYHLAQNHSGNGAKGESYESHIGYYLCDEGIHTLCEIFHANANVCPVATYVQKRRIALWYCSMQYGAAMSLAGLWMLFLPKLSSTPLMFAIEYLLLVAVILQASRGFISMIATRLIRPSRLMSLSLGVEESLFKDVVFVMPCKLVDSCQVNELLWNVETLYRQNMSLQLSCVLLTDFVDNKFGDTENVNAELLEECRILIDRLNSKYETPQGGPFCLLHRRLIYNPKQSMWMGRERKRGKLEDFYFFTRGDSMRFSQIYGAIAGLRGIRYAIVLDEDNVIDPASVRRLLGVIRHPLNAAVVDPSTRKVKRGFGIVQPITRVRRESACHWRIPELFFPPIGTPLEGQKLSSPVQDLFGESIFLGKGVIDLEAYGKVVAGRLPENTVLSHDYIEGGYLMTATASDCVILENVPSSFRALNIRRHRWTRGDWLNIRWLAPTIKHANNIVEDNPLDIFHRWVLLENLRVSTIEVASVLLLILARSKPTMVFAVWLLAMGALVLLPYIQWLVVSLRGIFSEGKFAGFWRLMQLLLHCVLLFALSGYVALLSIDAVARSIFRLLTGRKRLEWNSSAQVERSKLKAGLDIFDVDLVTLLSLSSLALMAFLGRWRIAISFSPLLITWASAGVISRWLQVSSQNPPHSTTFPDSSPACLIKRDK